MSLRFFQEGLAGCWQVPHYGVFERCAGRDDRQCIKVVMGGGLIAECILMFRFCLHGGEEPGKSVRV